jgi:acetyl-CoA synthetase
MDLVNPIVRRWLKEADEEPDVFWAKAASELHWFKRWEKVFEREFPSFRWFIGGETNLSYGAVDRHVAAGRSGQAAIVWASESGERRVLTYAQLLHEVERTAAALRGLGLGKGDRITIYMPTCPEAIVLMLAAVRIGAIHIVVFAGFGAGALSSRIVASGSRAVFTADVTWRKGKETPLKKIVDDALAIDRGAVGRVVVFPRG